MMKFCRTIVPVILCIMYTAPIFGAEEDIFRDIGVKLGVDIGVDVPGVIKSFHMEKKFYKETAHIKPYPPFLRRLISTTALIDSFFFSNHFFASCHSTASSWSTTFPSCNSLITSLSSWPVAA